MKKVIITLFLILIAFSFDKEILGDTVYNYYNKMISNDKGIIVSNKKYLENKNYHKENYVNYLEETTNLVASNKNDLLNIYYTAINNGYENITFYCDKAYSSCINDITTLDKENNNFSLINQLVNVYNTYHSIESVYTNNSRIDISITRKYNKDEIELIDNKINSIINELNINNLNNVEDKIKTFHDYLANNNVYDIEKANNLEIDNDSDSAIGALFNGKAICSGYSDALAIFLDKLSLPNVRIATTNHVWNAVKINNEWKHIDLTWDDPIVSDGSNIIQYDYFLISTKELENKNDNDHNYDKDVYSFIN